MTDNLKHVGVLGMKWGKKKKKMKNNDEARANNVKKSLVLKMKKKFKSLSKEEKELMGKVLVLSGVFALKFAVMQLAKNNTMGGKMAKILRDEMKRKKIKLKGLPSGLGPIIDTTFVN